MEGTTGPLHPKTIIIKSKRRNRHRELDKIRKQGIISQVKVQDKIIASDLNKMEISNRSDREFKVMIIKIHIGLDKKSGGNQHDS